MNRLSVRMRYENSRGEIVVENEDFVSTEASIVKVIEALQGTLLAAVKEQNS